MEHESDSTQKLFILSRRSRDRINNLSVLSLSCSTWFYWNNDYVFRACSKNISIFSLSRSTTQTILVTLLFVSAIRLFYFTVRFDATNSKPLRSRKRKNSDVKVEASSTAPNRTVTSDVPLQWEHNKAAVLFLNIQSHLRNSSILTGIYDLNKLNMYVFVFSGSRSV